MGRCEGCPLKDRPIVEGYGPKGAPAIVGEAPGQTEVKKGQPFIGPSGDMIRGVLKACGANPEEFYYTNTVLCHPPNNDTPTTEMIRACSERLQEELKDAPKVLLTGAVALRAFFVEKPPIRKGVKQWEKWVEKYPNHCRSCRGGNPNEWGEFQCPDCLSGVYLDPLTNRTKLMSRCPWCLEPLIWTTKGNTQSPSCPTKCGWKLTKLPPPDPGVEPPYDIAGGITKERGRARWSQVLGKMVLPTFHPAFILRQPDAYADLSMDVAKWLRLQPSSTPPPTPHPPALRLVSNAAQVLDMCQALEWGQNRTMALDIESTGLRQDRDRLLSIGLTDSPEYCYIIEAQALKSKAALVMVRRLLESRGTNTFWVGQNGAQYDSRMLLHWYNIDWRPSADTMLMHYSLDERRGGHGLKAMSAFYLNAPDYTASLKKLLHAKSADGKTGSFASVPPEVLYPYNAQDVVYTLQLYNVFDRALARNGMRYLHDDLLMPAALMLRDVERLGVKIDRPYLVKFREKLIAEEARLSYEIEELAREAHQAYYAPKYARARANLKARLTNRVRITPALTWEQWALDHPGYCRNCQGTGTPPSDGVNYYGGQGQFYTSTEDFYDVEEPFFNGPRLRACARCLVKGLCSWCLSPAYGKEVISEDDITLDVSCSNPSCGWYERKQPPRQHVEGGGAAEERVWERFETALKEHAYNPCKGKPFNVRSFFHVHDLLYTWMGCDKPYARKMTKLATSVACLEQLPFRVAELIVEYRRLAKLRGTYCDAILAALDPNDRLHGSYSVTGTTTGRLSSNSPNMQNIPSRHGTEVKRAFVATPGWVLVEADYSQVEFRTVALLSGDEGFLDVYRRGEDFHKSVAASIFKIPTTEVTDKQRRAAKTVGFGTLYGMGAASLALEIKCTEAEAKAMIHNFYGGYPKLKAWIEEQKKLARTQHYVITPHYGRRRRFPLWPRDDGQRAEYERQAVNSPVQSFASDTCLTAALRLHALKLPWLRIWGTVHDSIEFEVREDMLAEGCRIIKQVMEDVQFETPIPFLAELKVGPNWAEMKEYEYVA